MDGERFETFDTRMGKVYAQTAERKRQKDFVEFLEKLDAAIPKQVAYKSVKGFG